MSFFFPTSPPLRVVGVFSSRPARSQISSVAGVAGRRWDERGVRGFLYIVVVGLGLVFALWACAYMACVGRTADLGGQIRCAVASNCFAASRWWQARSQGRLKEARIPQNKVRRGSIEMGRPGQPCLFAVLLFFAAVFPWWEAKAAVMQSTGGFFIKVGPLIFSICDLLICLPPPNRGGFLEFDGGLVRALKRQRIGFFSGVFEEKELVLLCRCGCGLRSRRFQDEVPRGDLTAYHGVHQRWRVCAAVLPGQGGHSVRWCPLRHCFCNLQAAVPIRRPLSSSVVASIVASSPSGFVPGDGVDGRCVELFVDGGVGPDCAFFSSVKVLSVMTRDLVVIFLLFEVLDVICNPTE